MNPLDELIEKLPDSLKFSLGLGDIPSQAAMGMGGVVNKARDVTAGAIGKSAQFADALLTGGLLSPLVQLAAQEGIGETKNRGKLTKEFARNLALLAAGGVAARGIGAVAPRIAKGLLGKTTEIGLHHSPNPNITGMINPSVARGGITAMDQAPGYSYFWNVDDPARAAYEVAEQNKMIFERFIPEDDWRKSAYITRMLQNLVEQDPNVPGTIARRIKGGQTVVDRIFEPTGQFAAQLDEQEVLRKLLPILAQNAARNQAIQQAANAVTTGGRALSAAQQAALRAFIANNQR